MWSRLNCDKKERLVVSVTLRHPFLLANSREFSLIGIGGRCYLNLLAIGNIGALSRAYSLHPQGPLATIGRARKSHGHTPCTALHLYDLERFHAEAVVAKIHKQNLEPSFVQRIIVEFQNDDAGRRPINGHV